MPSQLVIRIDGYPDEVVVPGLVIGAELEIPTIEANVVVTSLTADLEVIYLEAE